MTEYRERTTGDVLRDRDIRALFPNTSFRPDGGTFNDKGYDPVLQSPQPAPSTNLKRVRRDGVVQDANGNWVQAWLEEDKFSGSTQATDEAAYLAKLKAEKEAQIRTQRDELLRLSDYTQLPDSPSDKPAWVKYRKELRDIPAQRGFPDTVVWPVKAGI